MSCTHYFGSLICSPARYRHVLQPDFDAAIAGRRGSVPMVSVRVAYAPPERRGSEPALLQAELLTRQECNGSQSVVNELNSHHGIWLLAANIAEEQSQGIYCFHG